MRGDAGVEMNVLRMDVFIKTLVKDLKERADFESKNTVNL